MRRCFLCGVYAYRGFTRRWLGRSQPVWVCQRVTECERRRTFSEPTQPEEAGS